MKGLVYFKDGHIEEISDYIVHDENFVEFWAPSGKYTYRALLTHTVVPETISRVRMLRFTTHHFYKQEFIEDRELWDDARQFWHEDYIEVDDIEKIELCE